MNGPFLGGPVTLRGSENAKVPLGSSTHRDDAVEVDEDTHNFFRQIALGVLVFVFAISTIILALVS